jgi:hypothetical protein
MESKRPLSFSLLELMVTWCPPGVLFYEYRLPYAKYAKPHNRCVLI